MNQFASYIEQVIRLRWSWHSTFQNKVTNTNIDHIRFFKPSILKCVYLCDSTNVNRFFIVANSMQIYLSLYLFIYSYECWVFGILFLLCVRLFIDSITTPFHDEWLTYRMGCFRFYFSTVKVSILGNIFSLLLIDVSFFSLVAIVICISYISIL